jgi:hypothetical protein
MPHNYELHQARAVKAFRQQASSVAHPPPTLFSQKLCKSTPLEGPASSLLLALAPIHMQIMNNPFILFVIWTFHSRVWGLATLLGSRVQLALQDLLEYERCIALRGNHMHAKVSMDKKGTATGWLQAQYTHSNGS